jgi:hypothetical protein
MTDPDRCLALVESLRQALAVEAFAVSMAALIAAEAG